MVLGMILAFGNPKKDVPNSGWIWNSGKPEAPRRISVSYDAAGRPVAEPRRNDSDETDAIVSSASNVLAADLFTPPLNMEALFLSTRLGRHGRHGREK
jgi:hypothetical protein